MGGQEEIQESLEELLSEFRDSINEPHGDSVASASAAVSDDTEHSARESSSADEEILRQGGFPVTDSRSAAANELFAPRVRAFDRPLLSRQVEASDMAVLGLMPAPDTVSVLVGRERNRGRSGRAREDNATSRGREKGSGKEEGKEEGKEKGKEEGTIKEEGIRESVGKKIGEERGVSKKRKARVQSEDLHHPYAPTGPRRSVQHPPNAPTGPRRTAQHRPHEGHLDMPSQQMVARQQLPWQPDFGMPGLAAHQLVHSTSPSVGAANSSALATMEMIADRASHLLNADRRAFIAHIDQERRERQTREDADRRERQAREEREMKERLEMKRLEVEALRLRPAEASRDDRRRPRSPRRSRSRSVMRSRHESVRTRSRDRRRRPRSPSRYHSRSPSRGHHSRSPSRARHRSRSPTAPRSRSQSALRNASRSLTTDLGTPAPGADSGTLVRRGRGAGHSLKWSAQKGTEYPALDGYRARYQAPSQAQLQAENLDANALPMRHKIAQKETAQREVQREVQRLGDILDAARRECAVTGPSQGQLSITAGPELGPDRAEGKWPGRSRESSGEGD
ncbi:Serine/arginine repetitive matrix protein 2 [Xylographa trunciseda]|nr:Serine/arginine repetitive matrix protein 2 [Xylographa trunciseda]